MTVSWGAASGATAAFFGSQGCMIAAGTVVLGTTVAISVNELDNELGRESAEDPENVDKRRRKIKPNNVKGGPPRDPLTSDYLPDPAAEGVAHTTVGTRNGSKGTYTQGATFDEHGEFKGRTDVTNHGRRDHPDPHYHPATGRNSANSDAEPIKN